MYLFTKLFFFRIFVNMKEIDLLLIELEKKRNSLNLSKQDFAKRIQIGSKTYYNWIGNIGNYSAGVSFQTLIDICKDQSIDYISILNRDETERIRAFSEHELSQLHELFKQLVRNVSEIKYTVKIVSRKQDNLQLQIDEIKSKLSVLPESKEQEQLENELLKLEESISDRNQT